ncbi:esterase/lipase family protein [Nocardia sp. NPDC058497]|uniref:esterase/lipase family protein n=1 Tax=Nocardia sp. NPDC058497 TaxID=3346529 RepID=UPI0036564319
MNFSSMMRRIGITAVTFVATVTATLTLAPPEAAAAPERHPILFVHGWQGAAWNWASMVSRFEDAGYSSAELRTFSYDTSLSNKVIAQEVKAEADALRAATGARKIDIISHSMGGVNSRWYLKFLDGARYVDDWVSIGGPNHGTGVAYACFDDSCEDMRPGSSLLTELNRGDETPGSVNYGTWWSPCDEIINPDESVILSGAANTRTGCIGHVFLLAAGSVFTEVRDFVA